MKIKKVNDRGITLIALVITIVVLLILAGVTLNTLAGENGLINRTIGVKIKSKIAEAEEVAKIEVMSQLVGAKGILNSVDMEKIKNALVAQGFQTYEQQTGGSTITGVSLTNEDGSALTLPISLNSGENKILKVSTTVEGTDGKDYYVIIEGLYYKINATVDGVEISRQGLSSVDSGSNAQIITLNVTGIDDSTKVQKITGETTAEDITVGQSKIVASGDKIKIIAGNNGLPTGGNTNPQISISVTGVNSLYEVAFSVIKPLAPTATEATPSTTTFSTDKGTIDVIWLSGATNTPTQTANIPNVATGMTPVSWSLSDTSWEQDQTAQSTWYNYSTSTRQWANVTDTNGSYFVWIPRYAYRITYYDKDDTTNSTPTGYYDGYGMWSAEDGSIKYNLEEGIETVVYNNKSYIVHPAFMKDKDKVASDGVTPLDDYARGGWSENLTGFWVAKFEMSQQKSTNSGVTWTDVSTNSTTGSNDISDTGSTRIRAVSLPNKESWRYINVGKSYTNSRAYNSALYSHLIKNSEWGAVAYLTHSQYGRNGEEVSANRAVSYTGSYGTAESHVSYNESINGVKASSTGNVYGVYDLSGGQLDYVAAYCYWPSSSIDTSPGSDMMNAAKVESNYVSTQYVTKYNFPSRSLISEISGFYNGITGDATKEVFTGKKAFYQYDNTEYYMNWDSDIYHFSGPGESISLPFFCRGGCAYEEEATGLFNFEDVAPGDGYLELFSFRVVLAF